MKPKAATNLLSPAELEAMNTNTPRPPRREPVTGLELATLLEEMWRARGRKPSIGAQDIIEKLKRGGGR